MPIKNEKTEDKTKELIEKLENGIKETMNSERYKNFLKVQSQFHSYSFNNQILIYLQKPNATNVAGFKAWQKFERHVSKGEKGISILAPSPYKCEKEVDKLDPKTKRAIKDPVTGKNQKEKTIVQVMKFRKVSVFDISQTEGKELPSICNELQGNSINAENIVKAIKQISEYPIIEKVIESGAKGYFSRLDGLIALNKGMSMDQNAKTVIHEYSHSKLHNTEAADLIDRATKEVQAESVAYIVSNRFGVDTSQYSFDYLASWSSGKELKELKESFNLIQKTANDIINKVEDVLTKELELQNSPAKITILFSECDELKKGQMLDIREANILYEKLEMNQRELRKANDQYDYSKLTAGESLPYVSYLKTRFQVDLADGAKSEARFDIGDGNYRNISECIKKECCIDIDKYLKEYELKQSEVPKEQPTDQQSTKDKVIEIYSKVFPAIQHIKESTAIKINNLNEVKNTIHTLKEIKAFYKEAGNKIENSNSSKDDLQEFKELKGIVDDLKNAQLVEKNLQAIEKSMENQVSKFEMVQ